MEAVMARPQRETLGALTSQVKAASRPTPRVVILRRRRRFGSAYYQPAYKLTS